MRLCMCTETVTSEDRRAGRLYLSLCPLETISTRWNKASGTREHSQIEMQHVEVGLGEDLSAQRGLSDTAAFK